MDRVSQPERTNLSGPCCLLMDGHSYAYRSFFAIQKLNSPSGAPTNAIYGFIKSLAKIQQLTNPVCGAVVWDGGLDTGRMQACPDYKAQRPEMPSDLAMQLDGICAYLEAAGMPSARYDGTEADDVIATLAQYAAAEGYQVVIASPDKDFMQLVSDQIRLFVAGAKAETVWGVAEVEAKTGVNPQQIVDWLSLVGDSVDNIGGVPGVGPKTATSLLREFGSVDALFERLAEVKSDRLRQALDAHRELVARNRQLIRLNDRVINAEPSHLRLQPENRSRLADLYRTWGFRSLLREVEAAEPGGVEQGNLFALQ